MRTAFSEDAIALENSRFMSRVYRWMAAGLLLTFGVAYYVSSNPEMVLALISNRLLFWGLVIAQLGAVFFLSAMMGRIASSTATAVYLAYAALTGVTFSVIFLAYTADSIANVFLLTSFAFAGLSAFGYFTKRDLGPIGSFCTMGLFGLIGIGLISLFFPSMRMNHTYQLVTALAGLVIFSGLTAWDTQKIKAMNIIGNEGTEEDTKEAISGALMLYLDFINLFLSLLKLLGRRRD